MVLVGVSLCILFFSVQSAELSFLSTEGQKIVNQEGDEVALQGVAFGNEVWTDEIITRTHHDERDFARVKRMGMNAVRFYLHYETFIESRSPLVFREEGWEWLEDNIRWAEDNSVYLILNMHVPPGGFQSNNEGAKLWTDPDNQYLLTALWYEIARRYTDEPVIAGFDLLNEPVVTDSIGQWKNLSRRLIDTIRSVNSNHIVIVENVLAVGDDYTKNEVMNFFEVKD
ncbi:glycoside hydrolase family 5 protein, partial [Chitinivibrio alkaliphilus]|uniref:glycoside hydrolase family 5 protein n=1 Tax=Chitinivibrio alkaliphilus TaxID=1505232 RepID=UPI00054D7D9D